MDQVNPSHYKQSYIECIDATRAMLGSGFEDYLRGQVLKYLWRCNYKGQKLSDIQKASWYLVKLEEEVQRSELNPTIPRPE